MKNPTKGTLADKIAGILNTAPSNFDPEEEAVDNTNAQIAFGEDEDEAEEEILSKFRKENIDLLEDLDEKYAGKKTSRKNLRDSSEEESETENDDEGMEGVEGGEEEEHENEDEDEDEDEDKDEDEDEDEDDEDEDDEDEEIDDEESSLLYDDDNELSISEDNETSFKHLSDVNVSNQIKKGVCVRNQMSMWENLLEVRIQLQKCLLGANKMPPNNKFKEIKSESGPEFTKKVSEVKNTLCGTLDNLLLLQKLVLKQYPETKNLEKQGEQNIVQQDESDEEIPSDTDPELSEQEEKEDAKISKKRKLKDYEKDIDDQHKKYKNYRNEVIRKWHDKTKVVLKGGAASYSVLDQIEYNLNNNKDKLIKRTQLKRSQYNIVGEEDEKNNEEKSGEEYNSEIFDDDDFYHQLLRELIEVKSADITDPVQLGRQWIQLQNMRSKMKRKIDTRATKGRKIRYVVHNKLVNFMAPIDEEAWTEEAKTELYSSLFGKNGPAVTS